MNSSKNGKRVKFGQLLWIKLMRSPLICEPSWSWSVIIITWPYLKLFRSSSVEYFLLYCRPRILIRLFISALSRIWNHKSAISFGPCSFYSTTCILSVLVPVWEHKNMHKILIPKNENNIIFFWTMHSENGIVLSGELRT